MRGSAPPPARVLPVVGTVLLGLTVRLGFTVLLGLIVAVPSAAVAAQLTLGWTGMGTDRDPGTWSIRLTEAPATARGTYTVDGGPVASFGVGVTEVPVPRTLGTHTIRLIGPDDLRLADSRAIVDDAPAPPTLTLQYVGDGTRIRPGVWMIMLTDPSGRRPAGTYRINEGPAHPLGPGSAVVAVPYFPGRYTIRVTATRVTATNDDRGRPGDEKAVTLTDTREVR